MSDGTHAVEMTEEEQMQHWLCTHCGQPRYDHPGEKCLFGPSRYEARLCNGCHKGFLPLSTGNQRKNWKTTRYHFECNPANQSKIKTFQAKPA